MDWGITEQAGWRKGPWTPDEDKLLAEYVGLQEEGNWSSVARSTGLNRSGKSCRLRWVNYLRPGLKKGHITPQEECIIIELHALWGNKWSTIARYLPGRTDNEIKNYWRTHFKKKDKPEKRKGNQVISQQKQVQTQLEESFETNKVSPSFEIRKKTEAKQETVLKQNSMADQCVLVNHQDQESWDGLWNLDNQQGCLAIQNQVNSYFSSENTMNLFDGGYIF